MRRNVVVVDFFSMIVCTIDRFALVRMVVGPLTVVQKSRLSRWMRYKTLYIQMHTTIFFFVICLRNTKHKYRYVGGENDRKFKKYVLPHLFMCIYVCACVYVCVYLCVCTYNVGKARLTKFEKVFIQRDLLT